MIQSSQHYSMQVEDRDDSWYQEGEGILHAQEW